MTTGDIMDIRKATRDYAVPNDALGAFHLFNSLLLYVVAVWLGTAFWGNWPVVGFAVFLFWGASVRLFGIQHDNGHLSFFTSKRVNFTSGVLLGAFTQNAFHAMRYNHNRHHAYIGNLDQMESHEVLTWTVRQYQEAGFWGKVFYRTYRSAPVIFFLGPIFIIFIRYRFPKNAMKTGLMDVAIQNVLMLSLWGLIYLLGGLTAMKFLVTALIISACVGVAIVYIGHNHEETYWASGPQVDFTEASLKGASVIDLGAIFDFMTFNFAYHDLHHLNSKVPCYNLKACHVALSEHLNPTRLGFWEAVACIQWKLWDEDQSKMVRFSDLKPLPKMHPAE